MTSTHWFSTKHYIIDEGGWFRGFTLGGSSSIGEARSRALKPEPRVWVDDDWAPVIAASVFENWVTNPDDEFDTRVSTVEVARFRHDHEGWVEEPVPSFAPISQ